MFSKDLLFTKIIGALKFLIFISFSLATKLKIFYYIFFQRITQRNTYLELVMCIFHHLLDYPDSVFWVLHIDMASL